MTEDEDTLLIQKIKQEIIIAFPVNGLKTKSAEIRSACSLLESEYFEPDELKIITPAGIFFDAGIELKDLNGNTIPEGTEMSIVWPEIRNSMPSLKLPIHLISEHKPEKGKRSYSEMSESGNLITYGNMADISE